ncbi:MAG: hypothetical protein P8R31_10300 [Mariniblastus sp.]|nr:hypothetical protein [Mariniblastus sp.]
MPQFLMAQDYEIRALPDKATNMTEPANQRRKPKSIGKFFSTPLGFLADFFSVLEGCSSCGCSGCGCFMLPTILLVVSILAFSGCIY